MAYGASWKRMQRILRIQTGCREECGVGLEAEEGR